jgi:hypothetical protein
MTGLLRTLLCLLLWLPLTGVSQVDDRYPLAEDAGVIQELDFASSTLIIDGMRYSVPVDVQVEIGGSYGAFTMLETGMRVRYEYLLVSPSVRRIVLIQELPDEVELEGV